MAERGKPWHVCDDCVDPLANELFALAKRFRVPFDVAKRDRLDAEYREVIESVGYDNDKLTDNQRARLDELSQQMGAQKEPPSTQDTYSIYSRYNIDLATDWLKFNVSVEYGDDFNRKLLNAKRRFSDLEFKASQIINGDLGKESTIQVRYAIRRLVNRHYELLRLTFPDHESHPDRDELPDEQRAFEIEILDEYSYVEKEFRETAKYLKRVSALVRSKLAKAQKPEGSNLIERLLSGPDDAELTPRELALLEAHLKQPFSLGTIHREMKAAGESETNAKRNKLKLIRDFNRNLQGANAASLDADLANSISDPEPTGSEAEAATTTPKRRGRKKADYQTVQREAQLAADWERARESSVYKPDFAKQNRMTAAELDTLLDRVAKRNARSDK